MQPHEWNELPPSPTHASRQAVLPFSPSAAVWLENTDDDIKLFGPSPHLSPSDKLPPLNPTTTVGDAALVAAESSTPSSPLSLASPQHLSPRSNSLASTTASVVPPPDSPRWPSRPSGTASSFSPAAATTPSEPFPDLSHTAPEEPRVTDAERRRREKMALDELEKLSRDEDGWGGTQGGLVASASAVRHTIRQRQKRNRLTVLEASAKRIQQLESLLSASELAKHMAEAQVRALQEQASGMMRREQQYMQRVDAARTLNSAGLLGERFIFVLIDCRTGRLLDANSNFFAQSGWTPSDALQHVLNRKHIEPLSAMGQPMLSEADYPLVQAKRGSASMTNESGESGVCEAVQWVPLRPCKQYPRTLQLLGNMLSGAAQQDFFRAMYQCRWADGWAYEFQGNFWVADAEWVQKADGSRWRRPLKFGCAGFIDDYLRVDDDLFPDNLPP